jgi:assimilatory nitrate reductase catalytic subunit
MDNVKTTCPYCGVGCGLIVSEARDGVAMGGDVDHPANFGRICSKGANLSETLGEESRLLHPEVDGRRVSRNEAIQAVASRLKRTIAEHGPTSIAFYVSGQLLTEDYYVANKLLKGFIGSPHIDTNSRLCMASAVAGHKRAFGADVVPGCYEDLEIADLIVLVGSNLAWCHPVLYQRMQKARRDRGAKLVVIDPRRTPTCDEADLHLTLKPGTDVALFNGLLAYLDNVGAVDRDYVISHVTGCEAAVEAARADAPSVDTVAARCDLVPGDVSHFFEWVAKTPRTLTVFSQGVNQSSQGTDKVNAIINTHLATGRVGKPGASPFSITGQPNAMGGREVGGLANQLAAHMNPNDPIDVDRVRRFWNAPNLTGGEGLKAVDLFEAIGDGQIKAVWIVGTNPAVSLPNAEQVRLALAKCPLVIVSDVAADTDTMRFAHIKLPATAWGERDGTVTNSERRISRQRPFRARPGDASPDWSIMADVAIAMGFGKAFQYRSAAAIFREHAALSGFENNGLRLFDISAMARLSERDYAALEPFQWPRPAGSDGDATRLFGNGRFCHNNGRARMIPVQAAAPRLRPSALFPLVANSGRYRDQWHTMTRTGLSPRLSAHRPEPLLEIHPKDAAAAGVRHDELARVYSAIGDILIRVSVSEDMPEGQVFVPIHWTDHQASRSVVSRLFPPETDPISGQPESKFVPVKVIPYRPTWSALLMARQRPDLHSVPYWCRHTVGPADAYDLAGDAEHDVELLLRRLDGMAGVERIDYHDRALGVMRAAWLKDGRLEACLFVAPKQPDLARQWLRDLFALAQLDGPDRSAILAGRAAGVAPSACGALVCSCYAVGLSEIEAVIADGRGTTVGQIGRLLGAGTGCGSCVPELKQILTRAKPAEAA